MVCRCTCLQAFSRAAMKFHRFPRCWTALSRLQLRAYSSNAASKHYKIVIVGGGTGGVAVASRLARSMNGSDIVVVEPSQVHYYQPLWTLVGAGVNSLSESMMMMRDVVPSSIPIIRDRVVRLEPSVSSLQLENGDKLTYDHLVLALGIELRYDLIPGAIEALDNDPRVVSNYSASYVGKTYRAYQSFTGGRAVFTLPNSPIKCAGAPQKVMYLFDDYLRRKGQRNSAELVYYTSLPKMFTVEKYSKRLEKICHLRSMHCHFRQHLTSVNWSKSEVTIENLDTKKPLTVHYDMLHITPPMSVPSVLKSTPGLGNPDLDDFVNVDICTLRHKKFPNVWSLGDCAALPTSKTAAAITSQAIVLSTNLKSVLVGGPDSALQYDGYTACPIVTRYGGCILAEFDYNLNRLETTFLDHGRERYIYYFVKTKVLPLVYWYGVIRGKWPGPKTIRRIFHFGFSNYGHL